MATVEEMARVLGCQYHDSTLVLDHIQKMVHACAPEGNRMERVYDGRRWYWVPTPGSLWCVTEQGQPRCTCGAYVLEWR
jgi:hypothetical protein